jgi:DNA-binding winged helix-turn-helix (wHTH) protein
MDRQTIYTFGRNLGVPFRLEVQGSSASTGYISLTRGGHVVKGPTRKALKLLHYLLDHPKQPCRRDQILGELSPKSENNLVDRYVSQLRVALGDDPSNPTFIGRVDRGYRFLQDVEVNGELGAITPYPRWDKARFYELMRELKRGSDEDGEDLRISTVSLSAGLEAFGLVDLLRRNLRVKILFMDPKEDVLVHARFSGRQDKTEVKCIQELTEQHKALETLAGHFPPGKPGGPRRGTLEYAVSRLMPCGFVAHSKDWAILGIFLTHTSYVEGPMFDIRSGSELWKELYKDWDARWEDAKKNSPKRLTDVSRVRASVP